MSRLACHPHDVPRTQLCNLNVNLSFPQTEALPYIQVTNNGDPRRKSGGSSDNLSGHHHRSIQSEIAATFVERHSSRKRMFKSRSIERRSLKERSNGTIDEWYGCDLYDAMVDYAVNYTFPWRTSLFFIPD
jgi:carboxypeptidase D